MDSACYSWILGQIHLRLLHALALWRLGKGAVSSKRIMSPTHSAIWKFLQYLTMTLKGHWHLLDSSHDGAVNGQSVYNSSPHWDLVTRNEINDKHVKPMKVFKKDTLGLYIPMVKSTHQTTQNSPTKTRHFWALAFSLPFLGFSGGFSVLAFARVKDGKNNKKAALQSCPRLSFKTSH